MWVRQLRIFRISESYRNATNFRTSSNDEDISNTLKSAFELFPGHSLFDPLLSNKFIETLFKNSDTCTPIGKMKFSRDGTRQISMYWNSNHSTLKYIDPWWQSVWNCEQCMRINWYEISIRVAENQFQRVNFNISNIITTFLESGIYKYL